MVKASDIVQMSNLTFSDRQAQKVACLMVMIVYNQKVHWKYENFKIKAKDPENMLRTVRTFRRILSDWQLPLIAPTVNLPWFDYEVLSMQSRAAGLFAVWIKEQY